MLRKIQLVAILLTLSLCVFAQKGKNMVKAAKAVTTVPQVTAEAAGKSFIRAPMVTEEVLRLELMRISGQSTLPGVPAAKVRPAAQVVPSVEELTTSLQRIMKESIPGPSKLAGSKVLSLAEKAVQVNGNEYEHAVWKLQSFTGETYAFFKVGTFKELERTKKFHQIAQVLSPRFPLIDIEYPIVLAEGYAGLSPAIVQQIQDKIADPDFQDSENFREFSTRVQTPFTLSKVDPSGMVFFEMLYPSRAEISAWLKEKPMTRGEWGQIKDFFAAMNEVGFHHGDLYHNLFIKRGEDGRLKVTVMDFELSGNGSRDLPLLNKWEEQLLFWGGIEK